MLLELLGLVTAGSTDQAPKMLCGEQTAFVLAPREKLKSVVLGIHIGTATIDTPRGELVIKDGNAWRAPRSVSGDVLLDSGVRMVLAKQRGSSRSVVYAVYGQLDGTDWGEGISKEQRVVAWVSGRALRGHEGDLAILERIRVVPFDTSACTYHMNYGWDVILGDE